MSGAPYILAQTNWKTVQETDYDVAVLPWGATEAHNYHLPYATDNIQAEHIAWEAARKAWEKRAKVVVLPTVPYGVNTGQLDIKLCINMNPSTQAALLGDVVASLDGQGFRKLVLINGHGGNDFRAIVRELAGAFPHVFVSVINWYRLGRPESIFEEPGDHAGELETSNVMYVRPNLVLPLDEAGAGREHRFRLRGLRDGTAWAPRAWRKVTDDTGIGDPSASSPEKGQRYLETVTDLIASYLVELASADVDDLYD